MRYGFVIVTMRKLLQIIWLVALQFCAYNSSATIIVVENTNDAGPGSFRGAVADAGDGDTIFIDVKGTITLYSQIDINDYDALTIIGPYAKHNTFTAGAGFTGSLLSFNNSGPISIRGLGFDGGNGDTRHINIENCGDGITIERCLFQNNTITSPGYKGAAIKVFASITEFNSCSFIDNSCENGAVSVEGSSEASIVNCTFSGNVATDKAGALFIAGNAEVDLLYNTFVYNESSSDPEAICAAGSSILNMENNALAYNGTGQQMGKSGGASTITSWGGNRVKRNYTFEPTDIPGGATGDYISWDFFTVGLRATIKEDGFGLKYWPIVDASSSFINPAVPTPRTPSNDCRNAPRSLKGPTTNSWPDAGACEYTHLRVTSSSGDATDANSFLWTLEATQRKDLVHYVEFDIPGTPPDILFESEGIASGAAYIIDGFSQEGSAIPGPHLIGTPGVTGAVLTINMIDLTGNNHGVRFNAGASGSTLQGVSIQAFDRHGVETNVANVSFFGLEVGIDNTGTENGNLWAGVKIKGTSTTVGGWEHWQRNVISGNGHGVSPEKSNVNIEFGNSNEIHGNIIGGAPNGLTLITSPEQTRYGIYNNTSYNKIGSSLYNTGNIIVDNENGIYHSLTGDHTTIQANKIGIGYDRFTAMGNSTSGICLSGADYNLIGGYDTQYGNIIAHNGKGIGMSTETTIAEQNSILGNSIHSNLAQGIDLEDDDLVLPNDGILDASQQNMGLDFPEIASSENCGAGETKTTFDLRVPIGESYRVEFFTTSSPDPTNGEGEIFIDAHTLSVATNPQTFTVSHGIVIAPGSTLSATVTQLSSGNTSEFGTNVLVAAPLDPSFSYDDICPEETAVPTYLGDTGGTFRFSDPAPADGSAINATTGEVTGGVEGTTYEVIYGFGGVCDNEDTTTFEVVLVDEAFTFPDFCPGTDGVPDEIATPGGAFALDPEPGDGASITTDGGVLSGGIEGTTYTVRYIVEEGVCKDTGYVSVLVTPTDETFTMDDFCPMATSAPADPATVGGTFSFDPIPGDGATINPTSGAITGGVEGAGYTVKYTVGVCSEEYTVDVSTIVTDESFTYSDFCPDGIGVPSDIATGGGSFSFEFDPGDGAVINPATGYITDGVEGNDYSVIYTVGVCADSDTANPTVITVTETFTFDDFCATEFSPAPVPDGPTGTFSYGLPDPDDGSTITAATGVIHYPVEGTTYPVVQTVTEFGCTQSDTVYVSVIEVDEYFEFDDICLGEVGYPSDVATPGGSWFFASDPGDGATIAEDSGELNNGVGGSTYTVRYIATDGTCVDSMDVMVDIIEANPTFTFDDFCPYDESPEPVPEVPGGEYSFYLPPGDGESIDPDSGIISNPVEGETYYVIYANTLLGCTRLDTVAVNVLVVDESFTFDDFCWGPESPEAIPSIDGGTFYFGTLPDDGETIDEDNGIITGSTEGTIYEVVHSLSLDFGDLTCTQKDTIFVTALGVDESFTFNDFCPAETSPAPVPATAGGAYTFDVIPLDGATINSTTGEITGSSEDSTYYVTYSVYDETGLCEQSSTETVTVIGVDEQFNFEAFCAEFTGVPSEIAVPGGTFDFAPDLGDGALIDETTGHITSAQPGTTYAIEYTVGTCSEQDTIWVLAMGSDTATFSLEDYCSNIETAPEVTGTTGGTFTFSIDPGDGADIDGATGIITGSTGGNYNIKYTTEGSAEVCPDTTVQTVTLFEVPKIITLNSETDVYCPDEELGPISVTDHEGAFKVYWYIGTPDEIVDSTFNYTPPSLVLGDNAYYAQPKNTDGCYGEFETYSLFLSDTANMRAINDFAICLGSPAQLEAYGGVSYKWETEVPLADYTSPSPVAFSLEEEAYAVRIQNNDYCEVIDTVRVTFLPRIECDIEVFNAFSPNNDGKNDFWYIDNLINFVPNTVYIYSRWGDELQAIENYDNINAYWDGTDKNGNDLPPGTYFYVVITDDPGQNQAAWVQLVR